LADNQKKKEERGMSFEVFMMELKGMLNVVAVILSVVFTQAIKFILGENVRKEFWRRFLPFIPLLISLIVVFWLEGKQAISTELLLTRGLVSGAVSAYVYKLFKVQLFE